MEGWIGASMVNKRQEVENTATAELTPHEAPLYCAKQEQVPVGEHVPRPPHD